MSENRREQEWTEALTVTMTDLISSEKSYRQLVVEKAMARASFEQGPLLDRLANQRRLNRELMSKNAELIDRLERYERRSEDPAHVSAAFDDLVKRIAPTLDDLAQALADLGEITMVEREATCDVCGQSMGTVMGSAEPVNVLGTPHWLYVGPPPPEHQHEDRTDCLCTDADRAHAPYVAEDCPRHNPQEEVP